MSRRGALVWLLMVLAACAQEVSAPAPGVAASVDGPPPLEPPRYAARDRWLYSDGYALIVSEVFPDDRVRMVRMDEPDQWQIRRGLFWTEMQSATSYRRSLFRSADPMALFGAGVNQPVSFVHEYERDGALIRHETSWVIEGVETIEVPAGLFPCWVLVKRSRSLVSDWTGYERWWYSPAVRNAVRLEYRYGDAAAGSRILMSYELAQPG